MTTLLLYGSEHSGKTTWCRKLHELLIRLPSADYEREKLRDSDFKSKITTSTFSVTIYSAGDDEETMTESLNWAMLNNCDYHISAIRKGKHYTHIKEQYEKLGQIIWITL